MDDMAARAKDAEREAYPKPVQEDDFLYRRDYLAALEKQVAKLCADRCALSDHLAKRIENSTDPTRTQEGER